MTITKFRFDSGATTIDYATKAGEFRIKTAEAASPDLTGAVNDLLFIFIRRMQLEPVQDHVSVNGFDCGSDERGDWYRISGVYTAHLLGHKLLTGKIREMNYEDFFEDKDPDEYPEILTQDEHERMLKAVEEAEEFVRGKRAQGELPYNNGEDESLFLDEEDTDGE